ncbi:RagB/SusD family nutrient uptake outer membrane protein [Mucilaginibacter paludis]|uniref:RagB/SusD domain-containing protein n=1 Tax=Mucilaginibacter paludis DSM 18603 TaxID=714943 RepID=H1Y6C6_9SPHI|nr:RagB/SusD family nutrient uptake outer membrane protein [Mucilaginibacter paludis]EHQ24874.1 RagB/SusD domain-containing protein [Mucilaginibacter paludis DSM 18603]
METLNTKFKTLIILLLVVSLVSCKKDFLTRLPQDTLSPDNFYNNAANLKIGLTGVYNTLQNAQLFDKIPELDAISDNSMLFKYETDLIAFSQGNAYANITNTMPNYYGQPYILIQRANELLDNINAPGNITQADRNDYQAEARALRAIAYMRLVYLFGDVPLYTTFIDKATSLTLTRTLRDKVIAFIVTELQASAAVLGTKPYNNEKGRLTKQAVLGMLCKVLVYEARMGKRPWVEAQTALAQLMTTAQGAGVDLLTTGTGANGQANYEAVFLLANADNKEVLFAVKNNDLNRGVDLSTFYGAGGGNLSVSVHTNFVNDFYGTDGLPIATSSVYNPASPYTNRDPRLKATVTVPGDVYSNNATLVPFNGRITKGTLQTDFAIKKYTTLDGTKFNQGQLDVIILRYADILLLFAEAENEVNGPTTAAYNAINRVRARVNMPNVKTGLTQTDFRNEVIHERRVELGFEGQRWFDLVTLGIANQKINAINELGRKFVPNKQELFPIPQSEINLNANLTQNQGY